MYRLKGYEIPESGRTARGVNIINLIPLQPEEKISAIVPSNQEDEGEYLVMATKNGMIKKTRVREYDNIRKNGLNAIVLREDDRLIDVRIAREDDDIFMTTRKGMSIHFLLNDVRNTGRTSMGVMGMRLNAGDEVIGMQTGSEGSDVLIVSEFGMGKRTPIDEYKIQKRGGKGLISYKISEKTGDVIGMKLISDEEEIIMITSEGIIIQIRCSDISEIGRNTSGVKLVDVDRENEVTVASVAKVRLIEKTEEEDPDTQADEKE